MQSSTATVCDNLALYGLQGFREQSSSYRFAKQRRLYHEELSIQHWIETGRYLPKPRQARPLCKAEVIISRSSRLPKVEISKNLLKKLLSL